MRKVMNSILFGLLITMGWNVAAQQTAECPDPPDHDYEIPEPYSFFDDGINIANIQANVCFDVCEGITSGEVEQFWYSELVNNYTWWEDRTWAPNSTIRWAAGPRPAEANWCYVSGGGGGGGGGGDCGTNSDPFFCDTGTPLVIDMGQNGFKFGRTGDYVYFDLNADGEPSKIQWVRESGDEAFLAIDLNENGTIDDGSELFGSGSPLGQTESKAIDGYMALAQYDLPEMGGNADGYISADDQVFSSLLLWTDNDANGLSAHHELIAVTDTVLRKFETEPKEARRRDHAGNVFIYKSKAFSNERGKRKRYRVADVVFKPLGD